MGMRVFVVTCVLAAALPVGAAGPEAKTDEEKTLYALGMALGQNLSSFNLKENELELVKAGLTDQTLNRKKQVELETWGPKIQELSKTRLAAAAATEKKAGQAFLEKAAAEKGATKTASGLIITELKPGTGEPPKATDKVKVNYKGTLVDGTVFDASEKHGGPATFQLNGVVKCWTEGVQLMKVGGKSRLVCPSDIAYGDRGSPPTIKPGATLVFEIELLEIVK
jgi:FKBP-type peptidyl-prolyl cis-trans isomerase FkpA